MKFSKIISLAIILFSGLFLQACTSMSTDLSVEKREDFVRTAKALDDQIQIFKTKGVENVYSSEEINKSYVTLGKITFKKTMASGGLLGMVQGLTALAKGGKLDADEIEKIKASARELGADAILDLEYDSQQSRALSNNYTSYAIYVAKAIAFE